MRATQSALEAWRAAIDIAEDVYRVTKAFPVNETKALTMPLRRSAVSVLSSIVEGEGRTSRKELSQFLCQFRVFLFEVETQISLARRLGYVDAREADSILLKTASVGKLSRGERRPSIPQRLPGRSGLRAVAVRAGSR
ncbi:MAG: four helix bundle protein [Candidatus Sulfotelmatobacter sp.]